MNRVQYFKHSDRFTRGVPDVSVTVRAITTWFEVKLVNNKHLWDAIQVAHMQHLERAAYIVWDQKQKLADLFWIQQIEDRKLRGIQCRHVMGELAWRIAAYCKNTGII